MPSYCLSSKECTGLLKKRKLFPFDHSKLTAVRDVELIFLAQQDDASEFALVLRTGEME